MKPLHGVPMENVGLRATPDQKSRWEAAAEAAGLSLSEWLRAVADAAAADALGE
jgi:uncharacterized protein (DUF1778 family)